MRQTECFSAMSAAVVVDGPIAVLTFLSDGVFDDRTAAVLLTPTMLRNLHRTIGAALGNAASRPGQRNS